MDISAETASIELRSHYNPVARVNFSNSSRNGPLLAKAIKDQNAEWVKQLIESGADVNAAVNNKTMLFHVLDTLDRYYEQGCECEFEENFDCPLCLEQCIEFQQSDILLIFQRLLKYGANPNTRTAYGETFLISIINIISNYRIKYMKMIELLLQYRCDVNMTSGTTKEFVTPLIAATNYENLKIVELLIKYGADVEGVDSDGRTAMHFATEIDTPEGMKIMEVLLQNGVDLEKKHYHKLYRVRETLIHHVATTEFYEGKIELLLKYGGDINDTTSDKKTAMMLCASKIHFQTLEAFTKHIAKMTLCQLPVNPANMGIIINDPELKQVYDTACVNYPKTAEMEELKKEIVYENVTLYRVFSNELKQVTPFLRNEAVRKYFESTKFEKFPVFGSCLREKYRHALNMKYLLDIGEQVLMRNLGVNFRNPRVAMVAVEQVLSFLDMNDLWVFAECGEVPEGDYKISEKDIKEMKLRYSRQASGRRRRTLNCNHFQDSSLRSKYILLLILIIVGLLALILYLSTREPTGE